MESIKKLIFTSFLVLQLFATGLEASSRRPLVYTHHDECAGAAAGYAGGGSAGAGGPASAAHSGDSQHLVSRSRIGLALAGAGHAGGSTTEPRGQHAVAVTPVSKALKVTGPAQKPFVSLSRASRPLREQLDELFADVVKELSKPDFDVVAFTEQFGEALNAISCENNSSHDPCHKQKIVRAFDKIFKSEEAGLSPVCMGNWQQFADFCAEEAAELMAAFNEELNNLDEGTVIENVILLLNYYSYNPCILLSGVVKDILSLVHDVESIFPALEASIIETLKALSLQEVVVADDPTEEAETELP